MYSSIIFQVHSIRINLDSYLSNYDAVCMFVYLRYMIQQRIAQRYVSFCRQFVEGHLDFCAHCLSGKVTRLEVPLLL